jgi:hypothetical protein
MSRKEIGRVWRSLRTKREREEMKTVYDLRRSNRTVGEGEDREGGRDRGRGRGR